MAGSSKAVDRVYRSTALTLSTHQTAHREVLAAERLAQLAIERAVDFIAAKRGGEEAVVANHHVVLLEQDDQLKGWVRRSVEWWSGEAAECSSGGAVRRWSA